MARRLAHEDAPSLQRLWRQCTQFSEENVARMEQGLYPIFLRHVVFVIHVGSSGRAQHQLPYQVAVSGVATRRRVFSQDELPSLH